MIIPNDIDMDHINNNFHREYNIQNYNDIIHPTQGRGQGKSLGGRRNLGAGGPGGRAPWWGSGGRSPLKLKPL